MRKELYNERFEEEKLACKERAGWQCEAILPWTNERCPTRDGDEKWSRRSKRKWIVYVHAAHVNGDPENPTPELVCLCPSCHMRMDRQKENAERPTQRRRGYELTSTDRLVEAAGSAGLTLSAMSECYHWHLEGTFLRRLRKHGCFCRWTCDSANENRAPLPGHDGARESWAAAKKKTVSKSASTGLLKRC